MRRFVMLLLLSTANIAQARSHHYAPPSVALPAIYPNASASTDIPAAHRHWWQAFNDPVLDRLMATALADNLDIAVAAARLERAAAGLRGARAAQRAQIDASASAAIQQLSTEDPANALPSRVPGFDRTVERYGLGFGASWEIDLFGRLSAGRQAAEADRTAAIADLDGARLTVAAELANTYLTTRELQRRLSIARARVTTLGRLDRLVAMRVERGIGATLDRDRSTAELRGAEAGIPVLEAVLASLYNRIDTLAGRPIGSAANELGTGDVPAAPIAIAADPPAGLITRRPDLVAAERRVAAADARVAQAIASRKPSLNLSGLLGLLTGGLSNLFNGGAVQAGGQALIGTPLFDGGRGKARVEGARGGFDEAVASYRAAVLRAAGEVDDGLSALTRRRAQAEALAASETALIAARHRADLAYKAGAASLTDVLDAERQLETVQDGLATARAEQARAAVATWRAMGSI